MKIFFALLAFAAVLLAGCVTQYRVVVDFSPTLREHFGEFPTIEVDIAAVTESEANEVREMGVETYFAPGGGIRERLQVQTCFFYREQQYSFMLPSRAPVWWAWRLRNPDYILVIASLPPAPSMTARDDPRLLTVRMVRSFVFARTINILVEPQRITQVARESRASRTRGERSPAVEQWVETR